MFVENVTHNLCCQIWADDHSSTCTFTTEKSVTFTGACANEIIPSINCSFVYKAKEGPHVRIKIFLLLLRICEKKWLKLPRYFAIMSIYIYIILVCIWFCFCCLFIFLQTYSHETIWQFLDRNLFILDWDLFLFCYETFYTNVY